MDYILLVLIMIARIFPIAITLYMGKNHFLYLDNYRRIIWILKIAILHLAVYSISIFAYIRNLAFKQLIISIMTHAVTYDFMRYLPYTFGVCMSFGLLLGEYEKKRHYSCNRDVTEKVVIVVSLAIMAILLFYFGTDHLVINEVCSNNRSMLLGENNCPSDYVELYNNGPFCLEVNGVYLSDNEDKLDKYKLPEMYLLGHEYHLVILDEAGFGLKKNGEELVLLSRDGSRIMECVEIPPLEEDLAFMRKTDGGNKWVAMHGTPGYSNNDSYNMVPEPVFSVASGFYSDAFTLYIDTVENCNVFYTTDGSLPNEKSNLYVDGIKIYNNSGTPEYVNNVHMQKEWWDKETDTTSVDKAFVVRAIAIGESNGTNLKSKVTSATYFVGLDSYKNENVISVIVDPEDMWGEDGIAVTGKGYDEWYYNGMIDGEELEANFGKSGRKYEIPCHMDSFISGKNCQQDECGLRIAGSSSRGLKSKRLSFTARKAYGGSSFLGFEFPENEIRLHKMKIRQSTADAILSSLANDLAVAHLDTIPVAVFANGEFWYRGFAQERYDTDYFEQKYEIPKDELVVVKGGQLDIGRLEDIELKNKLMNYIYDTKLTSDEAYKELCSMLDVDSYIDYICYNIYADNNDITDTKNVVMYRSRNKIDDEYADGRWRYCLYDMDALEYANYKDYNLKMQAEKNTFELMPRYETTPIGNLPMLKSLMANASFRERFEKRFVEIAYKNFNMNNIDILLKEYDGYYMNYRGNKMDKMYYVDFFENRADYIIPYMHEYIDKMGQKNNNM